MSVLCAIYSTEYSTESPELSNFSTFSITAATTLTERAVLPEIKFSYKAMRRNCQMQECPSSCSTLVKIHIPTAIEWMMAAT